MEKTYDIKLDLYKADVSKVDSSKRAIQFVTGDENVYSVTLRLIADDQDYAIDAGTTATVNIKPANAISATDVEAIVMDAATGLLKVSFAGGFEVLGDYTATVYLRKGANSLTWGQRFLFNVATGVASVS